MCQASQNVRPGVVEGVLLPAGDVGVLVLAARLSVATEGEEVIAGGSVLPGALVEVRPAPRIERNGFLQGLAALQEQPTREALPLNARGPYRKNAIPLHPGSRTDPSRPPRQPQPTGSG